MMKANDIFTIGHSTRSLKEFIEILQSFKIEIVADVRRFPMSRKFPHFNQDILMDSLPKFDIKYVSLPLLGGRRKANINSIHTVWRHPSFKGYADYMDTPDFQKGINNIMQLAKANTVAYMCSEAVWWRCHRSMISDYLKSKGWKVTHIMGIGKGIEHPYTEPAQIIDGELIY